MFTDDIRDTCLNFDLYARPVRLHFHGHDQFRTRFGAFCTIAVALIVTSYTLIAVLNFLHPPKPIPTHSKIHYESFYQKYEGSDLPVLEPNGETGSFKEFENDHIKPMKFFAFGLQGFDGEVAELGEFVATIF